MINQCQIDTRLFARVCGCTIESSTLLQFSRKIEQKIDGNMFDSIEFDFE